MAAAADTSGRRALLVASGTYSDAGLARLRAPAGDVDALAAVLGDAAIGGFEVQALVDRSTDEIKRAIEDFFAEAGRTDLLLLYFSGHGVLSKRRRFYFATATTSLKYLWTTAIDDDFVNGLMHESRARSIVLILDCCHSGAFGKGLTPKSAQTVDVEHHFDGDGRVTLSASTALEYAFEEGDPATGINELEPSAPGSLFTSCLVDGLRNGEADIDGDGVISVHELYDFARKRVRERSTHQTPGIGGDQRGDIVIAHAPHRAPAPPPPKPRIPEPAPPPEPTRRRSWQAVVSLVGAVVSIAAGILGIVSWFGGGPEPPTPPVTAYDFDRDGKQEIVLGAARGIEPGGSVLSGAVLLHRGSEAEGTTAISSADAGVPGPPTQGDRFGAALASGDFDGDDRPDLAIGTPGRDLVSVIYGPPGESDRRPQVIQGDALPTPPATQDFGFALLAADFNGDGFDDLVVGAPGSRAQRANFELGAAQLIPGARGRLDTGGARPVQAPADAFGFGSSLAAGDLDGDGALDLASGSRDEPEIDLHGHLAFCHGPPPLDCGLAPGDNDIGTSSLAVADVDADGFDDVVQGDQGSDSEDDNFPNVAGVVRVWPGREGGPGPERRTIAQDTVGVPGGPEAGDRFGHAVDAGDVDGDNVADIVVAAPTDEDGAGSVTIIRGTRTPRSRAAAYSLDVDEGVEGELGGSISLLDLDGDRRVDIVVAREHATSGDDALVAYMREGNRFGPSVELTGLDGLSGLEDSPLRIGR
jgi:Caspase domain/FG-GAP repeat